MTSVTSVDARVRNSEGGPVGDDDVLETTRQSRWDRIAFGPSSDPRWVRPALLALLGATAVLYLRNLTVSGWGNEFYAAAAQAGTQSWQALLFASHDAGNAITVDKPPAAMWVMGLSGRLFGFNAWSVLAPQALMGIGSVALLYAVVRRWSGPGAGLLAGAALAATPVAALMFRYDNPDAQLTLLLVAAAYCTVRAIDARSPRWLSAGTGWLALAGVAVGFAFLTKMMQAFLVLPALGLVFLVAAAGGFWSRIGKLATACAAMVVAGGWFVLLVEWWPADSRPYIGGSTNNSLWELAVGYNGLGRLLGGHGDPGGGGAERGPAGPMMGGAFGGDTGVTRLFRDLIGTEVSWLLPAALIGLVAGVWITLRASHTDRFRAALILWGGWVLGTGAVFSYMSGTIHPYYTVALAPGIAAVAGMAVVELWGRREQLVARITLAVMSSVTGVWAFALLGRTPDWLPWLRWIILIGALAAAFGLILGAHRTRRVAVVVAAAAVLFGLAGSAAYAIETAARAHSGGIPSSGPAHATMGGPFGGTPGGAAPTDSGPGGPGGPTGGQPDTSDENPALNALLTGTNSRWSAAAVGSFSASGLELQTGTSIMAVGGFSGRDNSPTLEQFQHNVANGEIGYFLMEERSGSRPPRNGGDSDVTKSMGDQISEWVKMHYTATKVGAMTVYDLTKPTGS
jgi:4-amino-4-deoxy-L-arabinose transferase-like glycosyltransferase